MTDTQKHPIDPADLPPETLIKFADFAHLMPGVTRLSIDRASVAGRFVPGTRFTPRAPMHFKAGDVAAYLAARMAELEVGK